MKVLISRKTGNYYYYNEKGQYHCKEGFIEEEELKSGKPVVFNNKGREFLVFNANNHDKYAKISRGPQIITEKDLGYIIARTGVDKNSKIIEAGGGSGGATTFFSRIVKTLHTYEIREDHLEIIKKNIDYFNCDNVKLQLGDLADHIENEEKESTDLLFLDMPEPNNVLKKDISTLKSGHYAVCYVPSVSQIQEITELVKEKPELYLEEITEVQLRHWRVWERLARPEFRKEIDHTAFLVFLRKN